VDCRGLGSATKSDRRRLSEIPIGGWRFTPSAKGLKPAKRRELVREIRQAYELNESRACGLIGITRWSNQLRVKSGLSEDGAKLVDATLCGSAPRIAINDLLTDSQRSEQSGFANLVKGVFGMFRNPTAHEARVLWCMSKEDAEDLLSIASLIHRRIDAAR